MNFDIWSIVLSLPGIILALSFHEFAHAYVSDRLGDPTPRNAGRLTLSPLAHLDPIGLLMIIFARFGWARPVPINPRYYKNPKRDEILVSAAGPAMNLLLAVAFMALLKLTIVYDLSGFLSQSVFNNLQILLYVTVVVNVGLGLFNLIPIPPLDGFHILANIIHPRHYRILATMEQYSTIILILLIVTRATQYIIGIPRDYIVSGLAILFGI
jgi:Zn-dependent protease